MTLTTKSAFLDGWNREIACDGQVEGGIQDVVWNAITDNDATGRTWGPPDGVLRVRSFFLWGWNPSMVGEISVPVLIIDGEFDQSVPPTSSGSTTSSPESQTVTSCCSWSSARATTWSGNDSARCCTASRRRGSGTARWGLP
jgi:pimeloyl-ACP methyl ester carboxylesterase